jgi:hypothetical protein
MQRHAPGGGIPHRASLRVSPDLQQETASSCEELQTPERLNSRPSVPEAVTPAIYRVTSPAAWIAGSPDAADWYLSLSIDIPSYFLYCPRLRESAMGLIGATMFLSPEDVEAVARRTVELLNGAGPSTFKLVGARELADRLGVCLDNV